MQNVADSKRRKFIADSAKLASVAMIASALPLMAKDSKTAKTQSNGVKMDFVTLNNGVKMPMIGLGLLNLRDLKECQRVIEDALEVGYTLFDTAQAYTNEAALGNALKATGVKRESVFITTKLFRSYATEDAVKRAFDESAKKLQVEVVDLFLIHQPINDVYSQWRAMSELYKQKRIRAIGVSNFYPDRLVDFCMNNEIIPAVNQVVANPFRHNESLQETMKEFNVQMEAFAPFASGKNDIFKNQTLDKIAKKHDKSIAQVILRWLYERGIVSIPKSTNKERMRQNLSIFDFTLDKSDKAQIATLQVPNMGLNHQDPKTIKWLNELNIGDSAATAGHKMKK